MFILIYLFQFIHFYFGVFFAFIIFIFSSWCFYFHSLFSFHLSWYLLFFAFIIFIFFILVLLFLFYLSWYFYFYSLFLFYLSWYFFAFNIFILFILVFLFSFIILILFILVLLFASHFAFIIPVHVFLAVFRRGCWEGAGAGPCDRKPRSSWHPLLPNQGRGFVTKGKQIHGMLCKKCMGKWKCILKLKFWVVETKWAINSKFNF